MTTRKKILYVITKSVWGGAQKYVYDLAANLPKEHFEVIVAAGASGPLFQKLRDAEIRTISILGLQRDVAFLNECRASWELFKIIRHEKPAIVHLNSTKTGIIGALVARVYNFLCLLNSEQRTRIIFTVHGWGFNEDRTLPVRALIFFASWCASLFHDAVILINTNDLRQARKFIPRRKCTFILNGFCPPKFLPRFEARAYLERLLKQTFTDTMVFIGIIAELTKNKGFTYLIEALNQIKSKMQNSKFRVVIIGEGEDRLTLENMIAHYGLAKIIFLPGFLPDASRYLSAFDLAVLPSIKEGLPYAILEAMAAGVPVVATRVGGIPDLVIHGKTGLLVPPKDATSLANALDQLLKDSQTRTAYGELGRAHWAAHFTLAKMITQTKTLYDQLAYTIQ